MVKPTLAVDIDDVLVPHYQALTDHMNKVYGTKLEPIHIIQWRTIDTVMQSTGATRAEIIDTVNQFLQSQEFINQKPDQDAPAALIKLKQKYRIVIITARPTLIQQLTLDWLNEHFPETFDEIAFVGSTGWGSGGKSSDKTASLKALNVSILIDDHPRHCTAAVEMGVRAIMFGNYGWNTNEEVPDMVERASDWVKVCQKLL